MSTQNHCQIEVAEEQETPFLLNHDYSSIVVAHTNSTAANRSEDTILPLEDKAIVPNQRLASLDVFRGLTVALMILVDDVGGAFPSLNHSPWFGVTVADFVMPFFLFGVGVSIGLVFKKVSSKQNATKKVILRTIKLFLLGMLLQGGYFHGRGELSYGIDLSKIRWLGVLQRISIGYSLASISEIWLANNYILVDSPAAFVRKYSIQWLFSILLCLVYLCLFYGLYVPNWKFEYSNLLWSGQVSVIENVGQKWICHCYYLLKKHTTNFCWMWLQFMLWFNSTCMRWRTGRLSLSLFVFTLDFLPLLPFLNSIQASTCIPKQIVEKKNPDKIKINIHKNCRT